MFCVVGLGNPGKDYQRNRHNIGFMVLDEIIRRYGTDKPQKKYQSELTPCKIGDIKFFAQKPLTYMNKSGISVSGLCSFYKIPLQNVIVIHDELDIAPYEVRVKQAGGHGGHNGLKSIDSMIGKNYTRIRVGIGHPGDKDLVTPWVLGDFPKKEASQIENICDIIAEKLPAYFALDGLNALRDCLQGKY